MTEFLEKLKSQELVVTDLGEPGDSPSQPAQQTSKTSNDGAAGIFRDSADENSSTADKTSDSVAHADYSEPPVINNSVATTSVASHGPLSLNNLTRTTSGLTRHRAIKAGCIALSLAILSLALVDLKSLIEKKGVLDSKLQFTADTSKNKLPLSYAYLDNEASEGMRPFRSSNWSDNLLGYADEQGNVVLPPVYLQVSDFHDGLAAVKFRGEKDKNGSYTSKDDQNWGYIDKTGKIVLPATYRNAGEFHNGAAPVVINGFGAIIDKHGRVLRNSTGRVAPALLGDLYEVKGPGILSGLVDSTGAYVVPPIYDSIDKIDTGPDDKGQDRWRKHKTYNPDYFAVWQDGKCGVLDKSGKLVMPIKFENIASYNKGHAVVLKEGSYGIADASGKFLIEPKYKLVTMYDDVIATMDYESHWKLFDSTGKQLPTEINGAIAQRGQQWLYDGMGAIVIGDKCGFVNNKGTVDIPAKYDFTQHFSEGYGLVQENGYWSYVDKHGKKVMTMKFPDAKPLLNGKAIVLQGGPLFPFINASQLEQSQSQSSSSVTKYINGEGAS